MTQVNKAEHLEKEQIASEKPVEDNSLIRLSAEDQISLVEEILSPSEPTPALLRARESYARIIRKAC